MFRSKQTAAAQGSAPPKSQTPYGGFDAVTLKDKNKRIFVETAPHMLVVGATGSGKSVRVIMPGALVWQGPRVVVSSKDDVLMHLVQNGITDRGPLYVMDLAGVLHEGISWLKGVEYTKVISDPSVLIASSDEALDMATLLMQVRKPGPGGGDGEMWEELAAPPLAALLEAAKITGEGMSWVRRAVGNPGVTKKGVVDESRPSWALAHKILEACSPDSPHANSPHAEELLNIAGLDPKMRDSVMITMTAAVRPWTRSDIAGGKDAVPFTPKMLEGPKEPTLAIIAPAAGSGAGAAVGAVETIINHWRRGIDRGLRRVLVSIDEMANTCPFPQRKLAAYVSEGRGLGVALTAALQKSEQMLLLYGRDPAQVITDLFPSVLVLSGTAEKKLLEDAAWLDGEDEAGKGAVGSDQKESISYERAQVTSPQSLLPKVPGKGRLLIGGRKGHLVDLPGIWEWSSAT